jgi:cell division septal protein FtsQ
MNEQQYVMNEPEKKTSRKRLGVLLMIPLLVGFIVVIVLSREWKDSLKVRNVIVGTTRCVSKNDIVALAKVSIGAPLYKTDLFEIHHRVMAEPYVKSARVNREFPDGISIDIEERLPIASINTGHLQYVDAEGILLSSTRTQKGFDLPVISGIDGIASVQPGAVILNKELSEAISVFHTALEIDSSVYHMISEINMNHGGDILLYSTDVGAPIILGREGMLKKLLTLETFWSNFMTTGDAEKLKYIDLRYEDQVVVKWNQRPEKASNKTSL